MMKNYCSLVDFRYVLLLLYIFNNVHELLKLSMKSLE